MPTAFHNCFIVTPSKSPSWRMTEMPEMVTWHKSGYFKSLICVDFIFFFNFSLKISANEYIVSVRADLLYWYLPINALSFHPKSRHLFLICFLERVKIAFNCPRSCFQSQLSQWTWRKRHQAKLSCPQSLSLYKCSLMVAAQGKDDTIISLPDQRQTILFNKWT